MLQAPAYKDSTAVLAQHCETPLARMSDKAEFFTDHTSSADLSLVTVLVDIMCNPQHTHTRQIFLCTYPCEAKCELLC